MRAKVFYILGLSAIIMTSCVISPKSRMKNLAKDNLEASLDYPKQLKITAIADPDSAYGVSYFSKQEIKGMLRVMAVVTKQLMEKTNGMNDLSNLDPYYNALIQRQMGGDLRGAEYDFQECAQGSMVRMESKDRL